MGEVIFGNAATFPKGERKDPCPCGSEKKCKRCSGEATVASVPLSRRALKTPEHLPVDFE